MPIYSYLCIACCKETEEMFPISARPDSVLCKHCGNIAHYSIAAGQFVVNGANAANRYSGDSNYRWYGPKDE